LVGVESEALQETMVELQSVMALSQGLQGIFEAKDSFEQLGAVIEDTFKGLKGALLASGIGAFVVLLGTVVAYWEDIEKAVFGANDAQDAYNETLDEYKKGATDAITSTQKVESAFKMAEKGVISKEEALQTYNETLGDSFGKATSLNEAEAIYIKKKDAYIKATALRAQANALFALAAEEQIKGITAGLEDQTSFWDKWSIGFKLGTSGAKDAMNEFDKAQDKGTKKAQKDADKRTKSINDIAQKLLESAETEENANDIISESEKKLNDERKERHKEEMQRAKERRERNKQDLIDIENELIDDENKRKEAQKQRETELIEAVHEAEKINRQSAQTQQEIELKAIEDKYRRALDLAEEQGVDMTELETAIKNELNDVNVKYAQEEIRIESEKKEQLDEIKKDADKKELERLRILKDQKVQLAKDGLQLVSDLVGLFSAKNERQAKAQFNVQKALSLAQTGVQTIEGVQSAFTTAQKSPLGILNPAYPFIQAGLAGAFGAVQLAKIAKTKFEGGVSSVVSGGSQGVAQGVITPNFNIVGNSNVNQLAQIQQQPIQAYVVSGQVTTQQALDRNRIQNATL
jgi:hypothetical protein